MKYSKKIIDHFISEEGYELKKYLDTEGFWTIGIGHKLTPSDIKNNLSTITKEQAYQIFENDLDNSYRDAKFLFSEFDTYPENTRLGILDMLFNLGIKNFSKFEKTIKLIKSRKFEEASKEALNSLWAKQLPNRSKRTAKLLAG